MKLISRVCSYIQKLSYLLRMIPSQAKLARNKRVQRTTFNTLAKDFPIIYQNLKKYSAGEFTTPVWEQLNAEIERTLLPRPTFSFLRHPLVRSTMVINDFGEILKKELTALENGHSAERLRYLLAEDYVGSPLIVNSRYLTSHNSIHHLYHMTKFVEKTKANLNDICTVVEWGGGYGNFAKIFKRLNPATKTYIIIDTPLFSSIQWLYLSTIFGSDAVRLLQSPRDHIQSGKINLLPVCFLDQQDLSADLFVSTWALSESSQFSQNYVAAHKWFKSRHILMAHQMSRTDNFPDAERVGTLAGLDVAVIEGIEFLPGNSYIFR